DLPEDFNSETEVTTPGSDSITSLAYNQFQQGGRYRLTLTETDTFRDFKGNHISCTANYPLPGDSIQHFITVFPNSPIKIKGNALLSNSATDTLKATSNYGEYKDFSWNLGNGKTDSTGK